MFDVKNSAPMRMTKKYSYLYPDAWDFIENIATNKEHKDMWPHEYVYAPIEAGLTLSLDRKKNQSKKKGINPLKIDCKLNLCTCRYNIKIKFCSCQCYFCTSFKNAFMSLFSFVTFFETRSDPYSAFLARFSYLSTISSVIFAPNGL